MGKHAFRMASFQCPAKRLFQGFVKYLVYNLCEAVHHHKYWEEFS